MFPEIIFRRMKESLLPVAGRMAIPLEKAMLRLEHGTSWRGKSKNKNPNNKKKTQTRMFLRTDGIADSPANCS